MEVDKMNRVILLGRLTRDPDIRYGGANNGCIARFNFAVNRKFKRDGQPEADFFNCTAFGKTGEFIEKYVKKGTKLVIEGEVRNDNYEKDGHMVYGTVIIVNNAEFAESKNAAADKPKTDERGFMDLPDDDSEDGIPFS
jgi:single-strand DNA-binding protein